MLDLRIMMKAKTAIAVMICALSPALLIGCHERILPTPQSVMVTTDHPRQLSLEAQQTLDRLNSWDKQECDWIERPETKPRNVMTSGESNAFVPTMKRQLAELGVKVKWNANKKVYEPE